MAIPFNDTYEEQLVPTPCYLTEKWTYTFLAALINTTGEANDKNIFSTE